MNETRNETNRPPVTCVERPVQTTRPSASRAGSRCRRQHAFQVCGRSASDASSKGPGRRVAWAPALRIVPGACDALPAPGRFRAPMALPETAGDTYWQIYLGA
jgi:hypothetical protein